MLPPRNFATVKRRLARLLERLGDYFKSEHWGSLRNRFYAKHDYKYASCPARAKLELHHKTYKRLGREWLRDVRTMS